MGIWKTLKESFINPQASIPTATHPALSPMKRAEAILQDPEVLQQILHALNLELIDDSHVGLDISKLPTSLPTIFNNLGIMYAPKDGDERDFMEFWKSTGFITSSLKLVGEQNRLIRYEDLKFMNKNSPEVNLMIETLVEEAISYKLSTGELVEIEVFDEQNDLDKETTEWINDAIDLLNPNTEVIVRGMALFGDHFVEPLGISQKEIKSLRCETDPKKYKRTNFEESSAPLKYEYKLRDQKTKILYPWEVIHYKIPTGDEEYFPYGISSADACRSPYRRLLVLEGLLALARAAKTDKLVVRIPTGTSNPEAAMAKLSRARAMWHDIIFGSGKEVRGVKKPDAFTEVLWLPEGSGDQRIGLERLTSTIDFTTTEDVEYFLDKLISATGMPRSYFKPDEKYQGYKKLTLQDLRFSRKVAKVVKSYSYGHIVLASIILALNGRWTEGTSLAAKYRQITPVADEQLNSMRVALDNISTMSNYFITLTGRPNLSDLAVKTLLIRYLDLDPETIDLMIQTSPRAVPEVPLPGVGEVPPDMPKESLNDKIYRILTEMLATSTMGRYNRTYSRDVPEVRDFFRATTSKLVPLIEATANKNRDQWEQIVKTLS